MECISSREMECNQHGNLFFSISGCDILAPLFLLQILTEILGDTLYYPQTSDALTEFPSPESLKGRIIISTKPPKEQSEANAVAKAALKDETLLQELQKEDAQEESSAVPIKDGSAGHRVGNVHVSEVWQSQD